MVNIVNSPLQAKFLRLDIVVKQLLSNIYLAFAFEQLVLCDAPVLAIPHIAYCLDICHIKGNNNIVANALPSIPCQ